MRSLTAIYSRSIDPASLLIRAAAWGGPWSHCGLLVGDSVIESTFLGKGVHVTPLREFADRVRVHELVSINVPNPQRGIEWALSTVGQRYDWTGVLGIAARRRDWAKDGRWYCSEHLERAIMEAGRERWRGVSVPGISPTMSYYAR